MLAAQGFTEVHNYSFISEEEATRFGFDVADHVRVLNPIAAGQELMRTSLLRSRTSSPRPLIRTPGRRKEISDELDRRG